MTTMHTKGPFQKQRRHGWNARVHPQRPAWLSGAGQAGEAVLPGKLENSSGTTRCVIKS